MSDRGRGFSLIELMIVIVIIAILLATGASGFRTWLANTRTRAAADAIQAGLHLARAEAVRRNVPVRLTLTSTTANDCVASFTSSNWVVSGGAAVDGKCGQAFIDETIPFWDNAEPRIIQVRPAAEGSRDIVVASGQSSFVFNGLGRLTTVPATNPIVIDVTNPNAGTCIADGGAIRCLRVTVSLGGQIRMCDPAYSVAGTDTQRCN